MGKRKTEKVQNKLFFKCALITVWWQYTCNVIHIIIIMFLVQNSKKIIKYNMIYRYLPLSILITNGDFLQIIIM